MGLKTSRRVVARSVAAVLLILLALVSPRAAFAQSEPDLSTSIGLQSEPLVLSTAGARMQIESSDEFAVGAPALLEWVQRASKIIEGYYGRFPTKFVRVRLVATNGHGVKRGTASGIPQAQVRIELGKNVTAAELRRDWILVHEMAHLAFPEVDLKHSWLSEGLATYVEGVARAQAGDRAAADVWAAYLRSMPRGLPQGRDRGLDHTHTRDRTYWGGALFCLLADVKIRRDTDNKLGLQDALRVVARSSGGLASKWTINEVLQTADAAVGVEVLERQYARMKDTAVRVDLVWLWSSLGIERKGASIAFHDNAPMAQIRKTITRRIAHPPIFADQHAQASALVELSGH